MSKIILDDPEENIPLLDKEKQKEWFEKVIVPIKGTIVYSNNLVELTKYIQNMEV